MIVTGHGCGLPGLAGEGIGSPTTARATACGVHGATIALMPATASLLLASPAWPRPSPLSRTPEHTR